MKTAADLKAEAERTQVVLNAGLQDLHRMGSALRERTRQVEQLRKARDEARLAYRRRIREGDPTRPHDPAVMHHSRSGVPEGFAASQLADGPREHHEPYKGAEAAQDELRYYVRKLTRGG
jgi:hypothetical protein